MSQQMKINYTDHGIPKQKILKGFENIVRGSVNLIKLAEATQHIKLIKVAGPMRACRVLVHRLNEVTA